jgi:hypothetical protein
MISRAVHKQSLAKLCAHYVFFQMSGACEALLAEWCNQMRVHWVLFSREFQTDGFTPGTLQQVCAVHTDGCTPRTLHHSGVHDQLSRSCGASLFRLMRANQFTAELCTRDTSAKGCTWDNSRRSGAHAIVRSREVQNYFKSRMMHMGHLIAE